MKLLRQKKKRRRPIVITRARAFAKKIIDQGYNIVPLFPYSKNNQDANWQNRRYSLDSVLDDSNVGINLLQSNLLDVDLDSALAIIFGLRWLPSNTLKLARVVNGKREITHYFYLNNQSLKDNDIKKFKDETILEYRCNGQTVVYGETPYKDDSSIMQSRIWVDEQKPIFVNNLQKIVNKIYVACVLCSFDIGMNQSALKLDSCLMRYTDWTDDERADFVLAIGEQTRPDGRDTNLKKMYR